MKANGKAESIRDWSGKCLPLFLALAIGAGCGKPTESATPGAPAEEISATTTEENMAYVTMTIGDRNFSVALDDGDAARELTRRLPLQLDMAELNGNEKYANLDQPLPAQPEAVRHIEAGDVMLWGTDCLVVFYQSFDTPYSYTRIGKIAETAKLAAALGSGNVAVALAGTPAGEVVEGDFYDYALTARTGETVEMSAFRGKVVLVVNTATDCGFTPQYEPLEKLYQEYHDKGLEILDIPCNQFGGQAPGTDEEIHTFCTMKYKTTFPRMKKSDVNGPNQLPLYAFLKSRQGFKGFGEGKMADLMRAHLGKSSPDYEKGNDIKWNFTKFVVDRDGKVVARFEPTSEISEVEEFVVKLLKLE